MSDTFFNKTKCDRCGKPLNGARIMSMFNEDTICLDCKEKEKHLQEYKAAQNADIEEIKKGNYNFPGIGFPVNQGKKRR